MASALQHVTVPSDSCSALRLLRNGPLTDEQKVRAAELVEDDPDAREATVTGLGKAVFELQAVGTAQEALDLLDSWIPDVVVSDIGMPGVDGYEFMRMLRARPPERGGRVAALALTAFAGLEDATRARSSGYQGHLAKPISPENLAVAIAKLPRQGPSGRPALSGPRSRAP